MSKFVIVLYAIVIVAMVSGGKLQNTDKSLSGDKKICTSSLKEASNVLTRESSVWQKKGESSKVLDVYYIMVQKINGLKIAVSKAKSTDPIEPTILKSDNGTELVTVMCSKEVGDELREIYKDTFTIWNDLMCHTPQCEAKKSTISSCCQDILSVSEDLDSKLPKSKTDPHFAELMRVYLRAYIQLNDLSVLAYKLDNTKVHNPPLQALNKIKIRCNDEIARSLVTVAADTEKEMKKILES